MMSFGDAQRDMRFAYYNGATGVVASATAWLVAGILATFVSATAGMLALIVGGMLIFPASVVACKVVGRPAKHSKGNPLGPLAIEGTIWMLLAIVVAVAVALHEVEWFFPAMLLVIAGRYLTFTTLYGLKTYWALGATLAASAALVVLFEAPAASGAYTGALIEYAYGVALFAVKPNATQQDAAADT